MMKAGELCQKRWEVSFALVWPTKIFFSLFKSGLTKETIMFPRGEKKNRYSLHALAYHFEDDKMV